MKFLGLELRLKGHFITAYDLFYQTGTGRDKVYEMVSRQPQLQQQRDLYAHPADAVILMLSDESGEKLLLLREFRPAAGLAVYNFPAGLVEPGESLEQAARRELREETGLELVRIDRVLPASFNAVGFSNETNACLIGAARGQIRPSDSAEEEIDCQWYDRQQVKNLLQGSPFESRTHLYCYLWANNA